jgi:hypothetical protein
MYPVSDLIQLPSRIKTITRGKRDINGGVYDYGGVYDNPCVAMRS